MTIKYGDRRTCVPANVVRFYSSNPFLQAKGFWHKASHLTKLRVQLRYVRFIGPEPVTTINEPE